MWERFDIAEELPQYYLSILATTYDNPYLTKAQLGAIERRIKDPDKRRQLMLSERPMPKGKEFKPELLEPCRSAEMDDVMTNALAIPLPGYVKEEVPRAGTVLWVTPPTEFDRYVLVGDPGQNTLPDRNSAVVAVVKVTGFPTVAAELAAWQNPDTKLRQDIASCLFMTADVMNRLFVIDESEQQETEVEEVVGASQRRRAHRDHRGRALR